MIGHAVWAAALLLALAGEYVWLRRRARRRLHRVLIAPLQRRAHSLRRSLAALARAALLRPYRGLHAPPRKVQP